MQACADLQHEAPSDTQVLNLLTMVLKAAGQQKEVAALYAAASAAHPKNSELLRGLFTAHVACGPFLARRVSCQLVKQAWQPFCVNESDSCAQGL